MIVIGMGFVWECRGPSMDPFYLCESCEEMISSEICKHMLSIDHHINFMCILLGPELYERVRAAAFSEALEIVKNIKKEQKLSVSCRPSCTPQRKVQLPEDQRSPEESLSMETDQRSDNEQPGPGPSVSPHQWPLPVEQAAVRPESTSVSVCPPTLSVSTSDQHLPTRKRPAVESIETLRYCTNDPNLKDPMPAKRKPSCDELQPIIQPSPESVPESTSVDPAATSVPLTPRGKDTEPGSDGLSDVYCAKFARLIALVRQRKSALNASRCTSVSGHGETTTSCASDSPERGAQGRLDPKYVETTSENPAPACALEEKNSSLDGSSSARVDLLIGPTGADAIGTMLPYDPSDPQHQGRVDAQAPFANASQSNPSPINCAVIDPNAGHAPQPRGYWENLGTGAHQLPINPIVTMRDVPQ
ncbi:hypothetical protein EYF80_003975 [Liparis tanakae]|uniref:Uncharacterized protein n=1 Tax=Liparis tanakae TaxID=230148 RepID=A0A4Z2J7Q9_9TELE|nr:hypothetical protein EYF80_003975 [Liparis tanakae]